MQRRPLVLLRLTASGALHHERPHVIRAEASGGEVSVERPSRERLDERASCHEVVRGVAPCGQVIEECGDG